MQLSHQRTSFPSTDRVSEKRVVYSSASDANIGMAGYGLLPMQPGFCILGLVEHPVYQILCIEWMVQNKLIQSFF